MRTLGSVFAWISFVLFAIIVLKIIIRLLSKHNSVCKKINKVLVKTHKHVGHAFIFSLILHMIFSWDLSIMTWMGWVALGCVIVSCLTYLFRKKRIWLAIHRILAIIGLVLACIHIVEVHVYIPFYYPSKDVNIPTTPTEADEPSISDDITESSTIEEIQKVLFDNSYELKDGTYLGTGMGYGGIMTVEIKVENGLLVDITVKDTKDSSFYIKKAEKYIKPEIINNQTSKVDVAAGATKSSNGYIEAVIEAIEEAKA